MTEYNDFFEGLRDERLSDAEKARMRNKLSYFMSEHPVRTPLSIWAADAVASVGNLLARRGGSARIVSLALALALFVGVGSTYAAEASVPGDLLYAFKVGISEPIRGAFAFSQAQKAQWSAELVSRRLGEAEQLAAENRLTPVARMQIEVALNESVHEFNAQVGALASTSDPLAVASVQSDLAADLAASVAAHAQILAALAVHDPEDAPALASIVTAAKPDGQGDEEENAQPARSTITLAVHAAGHGEGNHARHTIAVASTVRAALAPAAASTSLAENASTTIETALEQGDEHLKQGEFGRAISAFQNAIRATAAIDNAHADASTTEKSGKSERGDN